MYLTKALKAKKKLISKVNREHEKLRKYNSTIEGSNITYDPEESYNNWIKYSKELVELKTKIIQATAGIYGKIFEMTECKSQIGCLNNLNITNGKVVNLYDPGVIQHTAYIDELKRDELIVSLEDRIETLQSEIEAYNSTTKI